MTAQQKPLDIVLNYFNAWTTGRFQEAGAELSESLKIETPINFYPGKKNFMEAVQLTASMVSAVDLLVALSGIEDAVLIYDLTTPLGKIRIAEYFQVQDDVIVFIRQIHDTAPFRDAGFDKTSK